MSIRKFVSILNAISIVISRAMPYHEITCLFAEFELWQWRRHNKFGVGPGGRAVKSAVS